MSNISIRIGKLENHYGRNALERWLKNATDDELDARISEIDSVLRSRLQAEGVDCTGLTADDLCDIVEEFEQNGGEKPAELKTIRKYQ